MTEPLVSLKWLNDDVEQIEIEIRDGKEPSRIVYPRQEDIEEAQYEYVRGEFFYRILNKFEELYGKEGILSRYGVLKDDSSVLANLICWPRDHQTIYDGYIAVDKIPVKAKCRLVEEIRQMALDWKLSNDGISAEPMAGDFAEFAVDNYRWLFNFEVPTVATSLLSVNRDALELEWYVFNNDDVNIQKKFSALCDDKDGVGSYMANRWMTSITENKQFLENHKAKGVAKGE